MSYTLCVEIGENIKRVYELDVYKFAEKLSEMIRYNCDKWNNKQKHEYQISNFHFPISAFCERLRL